MSGLQGSLLQGSLFDYFSFLEGPARAGGPSMANFIPATRALAAPLGGPVHRCHSQTFDTNESHQNAAAVSGPLSVG